MENGRPFYEFFAGVGLARLGLERDWNPVWANDIDPKKARVYIENFGSKEFHLGDVTLVESRELPGNAEMAWASFPCQDLSLAGSRRGITAPRSGTFWAFLKIITDLESRRPGIVVLENVPGLLHGEDFGLIVSSLAKLQYSVGAVVINALEFLPQSRSRVFVIAVQNSERLTNFFDEEPELSKWFTPTLKRAFQRLSIDQKQSWVWWKLPQSVGVPMGSIGEVIEIDSSDGGWQEKVETQRLIDMMSSSHARRTRDAINTPGKTIGFVYKRRRSGQQYAEIRFGSAGCLRAPSGGSSRQTLMLLGDGEAKSRLLAPREAARLMGVPDSFALPTTYNDAYKAMGEGVAVPVVSWLSDNLLLPLAEVLRK